MVLDYPIAAAPSNTDQLPFNDSGTGSEVQWKQWRGDPDRVHSLARLATVSPEWRDHVERTTFRCLTIDPEPDVADVSQFEELVVGKRRGYLEEINILLNWYIWRIDRGPVPGIVDLSTTMEQVGKCLKIIGNWDLRAIRRERHCMNVYFQTWTGESMENLRPHAWTSQRHGLPLLDAPSLWSKDNLRRITGSALVDHPQTEFPSDMVFQAIKASFPDSVTVVRNLSFALDCVPWLAGEAMMERLPNVGSVDLQLRFGHRDEHGWEKVAGTITMPPYS